jgi:inositol hexakisphosphate/diphosphoinositol-pentakisphosphate kinase
LVKFPEPSQVLVDQLRDKCLEEKGDGPSIAPPATPAPGGGGAPSSASSQQAPEEWAVDGGRPCGGERPLLMFDRWRKLLRSFYSEKKGTFDISKARWGA